MSDIVFAEEMILILSSNLYLYNHVLMSPIKNREKKHFMANFTRFVYSFTVVVDSS